MCTSLLQFCCKNDWKSFPVDIWKNTPIVGTIHRIKEIREIRENMKTLWAISTSVNCATRYRYRFAITMIKFRGQHIRHVLSIKKSLFFFIPNFLRHAINISTVAAPAATNALQIRNIVICIRWKKAGIHRQTNTIHFIQFESALIDDSDDQQ